MMRQWLGWKYALVIIGLVVLALLVMDFNNRMAELKRLSAQRDVVAAEVTSLVQTQTHLGTQIAYATSEAAVMEWAYQEGHWLREGDIPVIPLPDGDPSEPTAVPTLVPTQASNWQVWFSLFFDRQPPANIASP
jgi:hypothetical protein